MESELRRQRARRDVMRATERSKEVVEGHLVGQIDDREAQTPLVTVAVEQIVVTNRQIKQMARLDSLRIVVVIFRPGCRHLDVQGSERVRSA